MTRDSTRAQALYEPGPQTLLVLASQLPSLWPIAVIAAVVVVIGWPWSLYAWPFAAGLAFLWLRAHRWKPLDQPLVFAIERDGLVLVHRGFRGKPRRARIAFSEIEVVWDLQSRFIAELRDGRTCSVAFGAKGRNDPRPHVVYRVLENRTGLPLGEHEPDAVRPWVDGVLQALAQQGVAVRAFPAGWRIHFWGGIARDGEVSLE